MTALDSSNRYDTRKIACELERTALGDGYYGNALRVAMDVPGVTDDDRALLGRYATGQQHGTDHVALQRLAQRIAASDPQAKATPARAVSAHVPPFHAPTFIPSLSESARLLGLAQARDDAAGMAHWQAVVLAHEETAKCARASASVDGTGERTVLAMRDALADYMRLRDHVGGCTDGGCLVKRPTGMHTNGGCKCCTDRHTAQRMMIAGQRLATALDQLLQGVEMHRSGVDAERREDMSPRGRLRLHAQEDGDMCLMVIEDDGTSAGIEFCSSGGKSPRTLQALRDLSRAMAADDAENPHPRR